MGIFGLVSVVELHSHSLNPPSRQPLGRKTTPLLPPRLGNPRKLQNRQVRPLAIPRLQLLQIRLVLEIRHPEAARVLALLRRLVLLQQRLSRGWGPAGAPLCTQLGDFFVVAAEVVFDHGLLVGDGERGRVFGGVGLEGFYAEDWVGGRLVEESMLNVVGAGYVRYVRFCFSLILDRRLILSSRPAARCRRCVSLLFSWRFGFLPFFLVIALCTLSRRLLTILAIGEFHFGKTYFETEVWVILEILDIWSESRRFVGHASVCSGAWAVGASFLACMRDQHPPILRTF